MYDVILIPYGLEDKIGFSFVLDQDTGFLGMQFVGVGQAIISNEQLAEDLVNLAIELGTNSENMRYVNELIREIEAINSLINQIPTEQSSVDINHPLGLSYNFQTTP